jgi:hypothetical protein
MTERHATIDKCSPNMAHSRSSCAVQWRPPASAEENSKVPGFMMSFLQKLALM